MPPTIPGNKTFSAAGVRTVGENISGRTRLAVNCKREPESDMKRNMAEHTDCCDSPLQLQSSTGSVACCSISRFAIQGGSYRYR